MKVRVSTSIDQADDIYSFFATTDKFGKCFYTIRFLNGKTLDGGTNHFIAIEAVAISRDLIYRIDWHIPCGYTAKEATRPESIYPNSYTPSQDWVKRAFYPLYHKDDSPNTTNAFEYREFIEVDKIEQ